MKCVCVAVVAVLFAVAFVQAAQIDDNQPSTALTSPTTDEIAKEAMEIIEDEMEPSDNAPATNLATASVAQEQSLEASVPLPALRRSLSLVSTSTMGLITEDDFTKNCCSAYTRHVSCTESIVGISLVSDYAVYTGSSLPTTTNFALIFTFTPLASSAKVWLYANTGGTGQRTWRVNNVDLVISSSTSAQGYAWVASTASVNSTGMVWVQAKEPNTRLKFVYYGVSAPSGIPTACLNWNSSGICGDNHFGQLGVGDVKSQPSLNNLVSFSSFSKLVSSRFHTLALVRSGTAVVMAMGGNRFGELGMGDTVPRSTATAINTLPAGINIADIAVGGMHSLLLTSTGTVLAFGRNTHGQLCNGNRVGIVNVPTLMAGITGATKISGGWQHTGIVAGGKLYMCGSNSKGQLGVGSGVDEVLLPTPLPVANVVDVSCGAFHTLARTTAVTPLSVCCAGPVRHYSCYDSSSMVGLKVDGYGLAKSTTGSLTSASSSYKVTFTYTPIIGAYVWVLLDRGGTTKSKWWINGVETTAVSTNAFMWYKVGVSSSGVVVAQPKDEQTRLRAVYYGLDDPSLMITPCEPQVISFGANGQGQLCSRYSLDPHSTPGVVVRIDHNATLAISAGYYHSAFLISTNGGLLKTPYMCGGNTRNQLGFDTGGQPATTIVPVLSSMSVTQVVAGYAHTSFLVQDKLLYTTGMNSNGQCATNDFTDAKLQLVGYTSVPAVLGGGAEVTALSISA